MNCVDAKRHLDLFLDGELDVETNLKVLEHLNLCSGCAKTFEGERWLGGEVRRKLCENKAPDALKNRICLALDRESGAFVARSRADSSAILADLRRFGRGDGIVVQSRDGDVHVFEVR